MRPKNKKKLHTKQSLWQNGEVIIYVGVPEARLSDWRVRNSYPGTSFTARRVYNSVVTLSVCQKPVFYV